MNAPGTGRRRRKRWVAALFALFGLTQACTAPPPSGDSTLSEGSAPSHGRQPVQGVVSVADGDWSDPETWANGRLPGPGDVTKIRHDVRLDVDTRVAGVVVSSSARLEFEGSASRALETTGNVIVAGVLRMRPVAAVSHLLRFDEIDESAFIGGAEKPVASDVGLWVMGPGRLDSVGSPKTGWLRTMGGLTAGTTVIALDAPPVGWQVGDEIVVTPTAAGDMTGFEVRTITSVDGGAVTLNAALDLNHPAVDGLTPEVANLTRNVRIEGTPGGRTHVFFQSTISQKIEYVTIRYVGPRRESAEDPSERFLAGRYGLHFHRMHDASRGSLVQGVVVRDSGSHAFVPHASDGITIRDSVAYDVKKEAFWWDRPPDPDHNDTRQALWDHCLAAKVAGFGSEDQRASGFMLGSSGTGTSAPTNTIRDSTAVGVSGDGKNMSGFQWPTGQSEPWNVEGLIAHNSLIGVFVWSNDAFHHDLNQIHIYNTELGIMQGAYRNAFQYDGVRIVGAAVGVDLLAVSNDGTQGGGRPRVAGMADFSVADAGVGLRISSHSLPSSRTSALEGWTMADVLVPIEVNDGGDELGRFDLRGWTVDGRAIRCSDVRIISMNPGTVIRVLDGSGALRFTVTATGCR